MKKKPPFFRHTVSINVTIKKGEHGLGTKIRIYGH